MFTYICRIPILISESKALVFEQISVSDKGNWTCVTDDDSTSKSFRMIVNGKQIMNIFILINSRVL